ncbi:MAG: ATP-binding protein [Sphingopyxis sp.]
MPLLAAVLAIIVLIIFAAPAPAQTTTQGDFAERMAATLTSDPGAAGQAAEVELARLARRGAAASNDDRAAAQWVLAQAAYRVGEVDLTEQTLRRMTALALDGQARHRARGRADLLRGLMARGRGEFAATLPLLQRAQQGFIAAHDVRGQAQALQALGVIYNDVGDGPQGIRFFTLAEQTYQGDDSFVMALNNNMGVALQNDGRFAESIARFARARDIAIRLDSAPSTRMAQLNIASSELLLGHDSRALAAVRQLGPLAQLGEAQQRDMLRISASIALNAGRVAEAERLVDRALGGANPTETDFSYFETHIAAYKIYQRLGRFEDALVHLEAARRLDAERAQVNASNRAALLSAQFQFSSQEARLSRLRAEQAARDAAYQRNIAIAIATGSVIALGLLSWALVVTIRSRRRALADAADLAVVNAQLVSALAAKTAFLASTSHEIRTPLNGILGMSQIMLADAKLPPHLRTQIELVHDAGTAMRALVDDILDVAKIEHGGFSINTRPTDVVELIDRVVRLYEAQAQDRGLVLLSEIDAAMPWQQLDGDRLTQILFNLVGNALKFTHEGSVAIRVSQQGSEEDSVMQIEVADTGIGIAPEWHAAVFDMFQQVDNGRTRNYGGTGLGLAICRQLAEAMGGAITLDSTEGVGSSFTVRLPWRPVEAPISAKAQGRSQWLGGEVGLSHIAIISANPMRISMLTAMARQAGFTPLHIAENEDYARFAQLADGHWLVDILSTEQLIAWADATDRPQGRILLVGADDGSVLIPNWFNEIVTRVQFSRNSIDAVLAKWGNKPKPKHPGTKAGQGRHGGRSCPPDDSDVEKVVSAGG